MKKKILHKKMLVRRMKNVVYIYWSIWYKAFNYKLCPSEYHGYIFMNRIRNYFTTQTFTVPITDSLSHFFFTLSLYSYVHSIFPTILKIYSWKSYQLIIYDFQTICAQFFFKFFDEKYTFTAIIRNIKVENYKKIHPKN